MYLMRHERERERERERKREKELRWDGTYAGLFLHLWLVSNNSAV
jgi:hypothetical protein